MKLSDHISEEVVCLDIKDSVKDEALKELAELLRPSRYITNFDAYLKDVFVREQLGTTGIGKGVAIPHARTDTVKDFVVAVGRSSEGVNFQAIDDQPVKLIILMGTPPGKVGEYLRILAHLSYLLKRGGFVESLMQVADKEAVVQLFRTNEDE